MKKASLILILAITSITLFMLIQPPLTAARQRADRQPQGNATPPAPTQAKEPALGPQSGDTQGLMIGASVIVLIILTGVLIAQSSRRNEDAPCEENQHTSPGIEVD